MLFRRVEEQNQELTSAAFGPILTTCPVQQGRPVSGVHRL
jgi:hypothetical protein